MANEALEFKKLGNAAFSSGNNEEAVKHFSRAIELDASDHVFFSNRSAAYAGLGKYEEALKDAEECIRLSPTWAKGYSRQGLALCNLKRFEDSIAAYKKGLEFDPENAALKQGLESVEQAMTQPMNPFASLFGPDIWVKIQMNPTLRPYLDDPDFVSKVKILQTNPQMITSMMQDPKIQKLFGVLLGLGTSGFSADPEDTETADSREEIPDEHVNVAQEAPSTLKREAKQSETNVEEDPAKQQALEQKNLGNAAYKQRQFDDALRCYEKAQELDPENAVYLLNSAAVKMETTAFEECIADCQKALEVCAQFGGGFELMAKAYARIGTARMRQNRLGDAIEAFEKSLVESHDRAVEKKLKQAKTLKTEQEKKQYLDTDKALEHKEIGNNLFREGKWIDAIQEYTESLRRNPEDHRVYSNRSACYTKLMDWSKALADINKCLELDSNFVKAYVRKGKIQFFLKQYHKAIETYNAGLALDPSSQELIDGVNTVQQAIARENSSGQIDPERQRAAMEDPEVQSILKDAEVQKVLQTIQADPSMAQKAFADENIRNKLMVLVNAGVLQMR